MKTKVVYLATPRGPEAYTLEGAWLTLVDGAPKKTKRKYAKRAKETTEQAEAEEQSADAAEPKVRKVKKFGKKKKAGGQATIGD